MNEYDIQGWIAIVWLVASLTTAVVAWLLFLRGEAAKSAKCRKELNDLKADVGSLRVDVNRLLERSTGL